MKMINVRSGKPKIITDLKNLVITSAESFGDKTLYIYKEDKTEKFFSYNDNLKYMNYLGTALYEIGLMGKHIAIIGDTHPYYLTAYYAAVNGGGVAVPLDKELMDNEIINFMNISDVSAVFYTESFNNRLINYTDRLPNVEYFIPIYPATEDLANPKVRSISELFEIGRRALENGDNNYVNHEINIDSMCAVLFTSGTTGTSKGVMLSQRNLASNINAACAATIYDQTHTFVSVLPAHHSYEMTCGHFAITNLGSTVYINDSIKNVTRNFSVFKPNSLMLVPLFVETMHKRIWSEIERKGMTKKVRTAMKLSNILLKIGIDMRSKFFGQIRDSFGGNLQSVVCGGAPISPQLIKDFYSFGILIFEGYGITECAPLVAVNRLNKLRYHSVGIAVDCNEVKIDKTPNDITGEICVKGDNVMLGYYKNETATKEAFTEDGWFRTGDIGYMDKENYIFITGRKKNVIILSNGKNVFPEEIEEHLSHCELIKECVVFGKENANDDIVITAVIYPDYEKLENKSADEIYEAVKQNVNEINKKLPIFKQVREIKMRETEFEKTTSKKIKRNKI